MLASWAIQRNTVVLPKSVTPSRIASNFKVKELPLEAFEALNALEKHKRFNFPAEWGVDIFDEVGEEAMKKIAAESGDANKSKYKI